MDLEQNQESSTLKNLLNEYVNTGVELDPNYYIDEYSLGSIWDTEEATNTSTSIHNCPNICEFHGLASREGNQSHDNVQSLHQLILTDSQLPPEAPAGHETQTVMVEQPMAVGGSALVSPVTHNVLKRNGRKRVAEDEGKVWRRKIKHREAAERSRARKAAYVAELEVEVNLLKKENARLQAKYGLLMKQMAVDTMDQRATEKPMNGHNRHRRCFSCPT